ncbi:LPS-assembly protein LptD [Candidatus Liberibacter solanacearum]|uniref:LPS-assembly protein LptD n=1 Tax=Candidatus Liberibacter solanacearum TaxID=556287 RepID=UPI00387DC197
MVKVQYSYKFLVTIIIFLALSTIFTVAQEKTSSNKKVINNSAPNKKDREYILDNNLLVSSDTLVFDLNKATIKGKVQIEYNGYHMFADHIMLNRQNKRIVANGGIKIIEPNKHIIHAEYLNITQDFKDGIIKNLTIDLPNKTYITASKAKLINEKNTIFTQGTYTACAKCVQSPNSPLFWMVKSKKIILNRQTHMIRLEKTYLEFFGYPVIYLPMIEIPDETVTRKTGLLTPIFSIGSMQKFGFGIPYYVVISDSSDATITFSPYPRKGILNEIEVRKCFKSGMHTLHAAYMYNAFNVANNQKEPRHQAMLSSIAKFQINPIWNFGWNLTAQTPQQTSYIYYLPPLSLKTKENKIYLTGTGEKNSIDIRALHYYTQESFSQRKSQFTQANVYPLIDYLYVNPQYSKREELSITGNITAISRAQPKTIVNSTNPHKIRFPYGLNKRLSMDLDFKRNVITPLGISLTPLVNLRGDLHSLSIKRDSLNHSLLRDNKNFIVRGMTTIGIDIRYPIVAITQASRHVLEGISQVYLGTNEQSIKNIPNEDAQSLMLNSTSLFTRNKFSGFDRIEGGSRANIGVRYTGVFKDKFTIHGILGQSIHLFGKNSFSLPDPIGIEQNSGLEDRLSDYVGAAKLSLPSNIMLSIQALINQKKLTVRRMDTSIDYTLNSFQSSLNFTHILRYSLYHHNDVRDMVQSKVKFKINNFFSANASLEWNINNQNASYIPSHSIGLSYQNDCTTFNISYNNLSSKINNYTIKAELSLRTIGEIGSSTSFNDD